MGQKYDTQKHIHKFHTHKAYLKLFFITIVYLILNILLNISTDLKAQEKISTDQLTVSEEVSPYSEVFLGDEQTPLFLFGREILSSNDVLECSSQQEIDHILHATVEEGSGQTLRNISPRISKLMQQADIETKQSYLLGFPLVALNTPLILGGMIIKLSYPSPFSETTHNRMFSRHILRNLSMDTQVRLKNSEEGCFLDFVQCGKKDRCLSGNHDQIISLIKIPVLGFSQKHQAVIVDPAEFGNQLKNMILKRRNHLLSFIPNLFNIKASQSVIVDFSQSTLIFDIIKTLELHPLGHIRYRRLIDIPPPQMTSRWFIKFGLETENDFVGRLPTQGIEYLTTNPVLYDNVFIYRQNISPESPVHFYVKNFPDEHKEAVRQAFQYWNSIHISLKGYPAFSYTFIQGDYDGQKEIIIGDIRYNVMEWNNNKFPLRSGATIHRVDQETGEILSVDILIQGSHIMDEYPKWFQYSEMIRANETVRDDTFTNKPFRNNFSSLISQVRISPSLFHLQVNLLAPQRETAESRIFNMLKYSTAHELGHGLGLNHNYKASVFIRGNTPYSVMDYHGTGDNYAFHYETNPDNYDKMALAYGYSGVLPKHTDRSCSGNEVMHLSPTVEEQKNKSPECSMSDATGFPLENTANKLKGVLDLLMGRKDDQSFPYLIWNQSVDMFVIRLIFSIVSYHFSADTHYNQLQTISINDRKPESPQEVKDLVIEYLTPILCDSRLFDVPSGQDNTFDRYLHSNVIQFKRRSNDVISRLTDINVIDCPDGHVAFRRGSQNSSR